MAEAKDFQKATAERIVELFKNGRSRVLLADEVGLGKTVVAHGVIDGYRQYRKGRDDFYKVVYICSNANVSAQNIKELGVQNQASFAESRLSMQHLKIARTDKEIIAKTKEGDMPERLIPLTPTTSFTIRSSAGTVAERALIYVILSRITDIPIDNLEFLQMGVNDGSWHEYKQEYTHQVAELEGENYLQKLKEQFETKSLKSMLYNRLAAITIESPKQEKRRLIADLRKVFADISMDMLDPDLVIMDEFQRFANLLQKGKDEQHALVDRFLQNTDMKILLLSATPYKPYTTLEEANEGGIDAYRDFMKVMDFLFVEKTSIDDFRMVWKRYSNDLRLITIDAGEMEQVRQSKNNAEDLLYSVMCRTERLMNNINPKANPIYEVPVEEGDVFAYAQGQRMLEELAEHHRRIRYRRIPIDYVKSSPYLLSFMDQYKLKKELVGNIADCREEVDRRDGVLCISRYSVEQYEAIPTNNGRLTLLHDIVFGPLKRKRPQHSIHQLLWIPASRPYYKAGGIFEDEASKSFSKMLIFSSWEMVPRMIAIMMSYYAELYTLGVYRKTKRYKKKFSYETATQSKTPRVEDFAKSVLTYPCVALAGIYNPIMHLDKSIEELRADIRKEVMRKLEEIGIHVREKYIREKAETVVQVMQRMDEKRPSEPMDISEEIVDTLIDISIASPAVYAYRINANLEEARKIGEAIVRLFNKPESSAIVEILYSKGRFWQKILRYCVEGNLQAVLDEYAFMQQGRLPSDKFPIISSNSLHMDTREHILDSQGTDLNMRTHFAAQFVDKVTLDEKSDKVKMQDVFNSPFRPFVLATTSVGQEGLNFHWYARKLMHWNLPSNPVDFEQREGRINRYCCHAIRRSIAHLYGSKDELDNCKDVWGKMMRVAAARLGTGHSQMVPYWCLPLDSLNDDELDRMEYIERFIPMYPYSSEHAKYERLMKVLSLYRLTLGQPQQENMVDMLATVDLTEDDFRELGFNLSPWKKNNR